MPAEGCNTLLGTILPEHDIPIVPSDRGNAAAVTNAIEKVKKR